MKAIRMGAGSPFPGLVKAVLPDTVTREGSTVVDSDGDVLRFTRGDDDWDLIPLKKAQRDQLVEYFDQVDRGRTYPAIIDDEVQIIEPPPMDRPVVTRERDGQVWRSTRSRTWPPEAGSPEWREKYPEAAAYLKSREAARRPEKSKDARPAPRDEG